MTGALPVEGLTYSRGCRHGSVQSALHPRIVQLPEWSSDRDSHCHWKEMTLQSHGLGRGGRGREGERVTQYDSKRLHTYNLTTASFPSGLGMGQL